MGRYGGYWLGLALLLAVGVCSIWAALTGWRSVSHYEAPYRATALPTKAPALCNRVLLIVLDGVRQDATAHMPAFQALAKRGSAGTLQTVWPSLSNPARATLVTGALPEVHGVTANSPYSPPPIDSIFSLARANRVHFAAAGSEFWERAFSDGDDGRFETHAKEPEGRPAPQALVEWQDDVCSRDLRFLGLVRSGFLVAGITAADSAGHDYGGTSQQYLQVVGAVDACLQRFIQAFDDGSTALIVTADHGHVRGNGGGGHGGWEDEVRLAPAVLAGAAIEPGGGWYAPQTAIAPTVSALLGLPLPALAQGTVLWETLAAPEDWLALKQEEAAAQAAAAAKVLPDWEAGQRSARRSRLPGALALAVLALLIGGSAFYRLREELAAAVLVLLVYAGAYYGIFWLAGMRYSLSAIGREEYLLQYFATNIGAAAGAYMLAFALLRMIRAEPLPAWCLDVAALCVSFALLNVAFSEWYSGLRMGVFLPLPFWAIKGYLDLVALSGIAAAAVVTFTIEALLARAARETAKLQEDHPDDEDAEPVAGAVS